MTEKEKAKAYDEALKKANAAHKDEDRHLKATLERIFPELKESEDEEIRKEIISILRNAYWTSNRNRFNKLVAWLEKQGNNSTDKIEPKFKVGDKIVNGFMKYMGAPVTQGTILKITDDKYIFTDGSCMSISNQDSWELASNKKPKFDPKTLQPFDKVLVRYEKKHNWGCEFFSYMSKNADYPCVATRIAYPYCIPYNDETKHLVGTTDEAPEFYRYWED